MCFIFIHIYNIDINFIFYVCIWESIGKTNHQTRKNLNGHQYHKYEPGW